jgi:hypothetical protein
LNSHYLRFYGILAIIMLNKIGQPGGKRNGHIASPQAGETHAVVVPERASDEEIAAHAAIINAFVGWSITELPNPVNVRAAAFSVFSVSELDPDRREQIGRMINAATSDQHRKSNKITMGYTVGFIALGEEDPPTIGRITQQSGSARVAVAAAAESLLRADLIIKHEPDSQAVQVGRPAATWVPKPELFEAVSIVPEWQDATRLCFLATALGVTIQTAITEAVNTTLSYRGLG